MATCLRQIGGLSPVCALLNTCVGVSCLDDGDCMPGERCVQHPATQKASCCRECLGAVGEHEPRYVSLATTTTSWTIVVTSTTRALPPTTTTTLRTLAPAEPEAGFLRCTAAGASCGPCGPDGQMSVCVRHIGDDTAVCPQPDACTTESCLWDRDCGPGRRCILNPATYKTNCCQECTGPVADDRQRYFPPTTTTSSTLVVSQPLPVTSTTLAAVPSGFQRCVAAGATCGPCLPSGRMSECASHTGDEVPVCTQPDSCVEAGCVADRDCGPGRMCVVQTKNLFGRRTSCCHECHALGQDDLFDAGATTTMTIPITTTSTLPRAAEEGATFQRCVLEGDRCGPCGSTGLMTVCQREVETGLMVCPMPGSCVAVSCRTAADCLELQRCVFNSITLRSNCCEVCE
jgi:hypothetical protein